MASTLILLHAALGAASQFDELAARLEGTFDIRRFDFEGHGLRPPSEGPFRIERFVENTLAEMDALEIERADFFGYSMGGYVAALLARRHPERVGRIMTLGTKWRWDPETAGREARMLDPARIREKVPSFARVLEERHAIAGWETVLAKTSEMMHALGHDAPLGDADLAAIAHRVRVVVGDRDATVGVEETTGVFRLLSNAELQVMPGTPHPLERVDLGDLVRSMTSCFGEREIAG